METLSFFRWFLLLFYFCCIERDNPKFALCLTHSSATPPPFRGGVGARATPKRVRKMKKFDEKLDEKRGKSKKYNDKRRKK